MKLAVGLMSGSIGVLSEAAHSFLDLVSAAVAFFTIRAAVKPADHGHPYGHGKFETLSSLLESLLLVAAAGWIVIEAVGHLRNPQPIAHQGLAIAVIVISMVVSYFMYIHNRSAAAVTESSAIHVNALHFLSDVVASGGVLAGLLIIHFTGWTIVDPIVAIGVAAYILAISYKQVRRALQELSDTQLPEAEVQEIERILKEFPGRLLEAHELRTRKGGTTRYMDFHLVVCGAMTVSESHLLCDEIEGKLHEKFPTASVTIHVEPCEHHRTRCNEMCKLHAQRSSTNPIYE